jgi:hypothetical protein
MNWSVQICRLIALSMVTVSIASCTDDPKEDVKTTLKIFMPDTSSMNVSRFRKETAPDPSIKFAQADAVPPPVVMSSQSTRLARTPVQLNPSLPYPLPPKQ